MKHVTVFMMAFLCIAASKSNGQAWVPVWQENFNGLAYESCYSTGGDTYWANCTNPVAGPRNSRINGTWEVANTTLGSTQAPTDASNGRFVMYWSDDQFLTTVPAGNTVVFRKTITGAVIGRQYRVSFKTGVLGTTARPNLGLQLVMNSITTSLYSEASATFPTTSWTTVSTAGTGTSGGSSLQFTATATSFVLEWTNTQTAAAGNDFGLDDLLVETLSTTVPVTMAPLKAATANGYVLLNWSTYTEINNKGFDIEHSINGVDWKTIGHTPSAALGGNSNDQLHYQFTHNNPAAAGNYYRLRQVDIDGRFVYSNDVYVWLRHTTEVFPNPVINNLNIRVSDPKSVKAISITDAGGRTIRRVAGYHSDLNMADMPAGIYYIIITSQDNTNSTFKVTRRP